MKRIITKSDSSQPVGWGREWRGGRGCVQRAGRYPQTVKEFHKMACKIITAVAGAILLVLRQSLPRMRRYFRNSATLIATSDILLDFRTTATTDTFRSSRLRLCPGMRR